MPFSHHQPWCGTYTSLSQETHFQDVATLNDLLCVQWWCEDKSSPEKKLRFVAFSDICGGNSLTIYNFKLRICWDWEGSCTISLEDSASCIICIFSSLPPSLLPSFPSHSLPSFLPHTHRCTFNHT